MSKTPQSERNSCPMGGVGKIEKNKNNLVSTPSVFWQNTKRHLPLEET